MLAKKVWLNSIISMRFFWMLFFIILGSYGMKSQTDDVYTGDPAAIDTTKRKKEKNRDWLDKVTYEGNLQLQLGTYTFIYFSPALGYRITDKLNVGVGVIYNYISINYGSQYGKISQSVFGGHSYARYFVREDLYLQVQYDKLRQPNVFSFIPESIRWVDYVLAGVGFRRPLGNKVALSGTLLYNLTPDPLSIYPTRLIVQFGFMGSF